MYRSSTVHNYVLVWYKPHLTYPLRASWHIRPSQSLSRLAAMVFTSSHDRHPASALSFSTVRLQVVFGLTLVLFPSGVQVIAMLQLLFWSCLSMCPIIFHLLCFTSLIVGFMSALSSSSSVLTSVVLPLDFIRFFAGTCYEIHPLLCHLPCSFSVVHTRTAGLALPVFYTASGSFLLPDCF